MSGHDPEIAGKRLLILGGGLWQVEYVRRARDLGVETWVTDWSSDAPGRIDAAHFAAVDLKDREGTLALAASARIDGVLTAADIGVPTAAYLVEQLGLHGYRGIVAELATNKYAMRERARALGIACPWYRRVRSLDEARRVVDETALPVIVKPVDSCSSRGVRWVDAIDSLAPAVAAAIAVSRAGEALVEQFLAGAEGSIEALVQDGRAIVLGICDKTKSPLPDRFDLELRYPGAYTAATSSRLEALAQTVASGYGLENGILHIEFLVDASSGAVFLIEFAVRGCGSKVVTHLIPAMTGVDVPRVLIRQAFGLRSVIEPERGRHGALQFLMFPSGRVTAVRGIDEARCIAGVIDACIERAPGDRIDEVHDGRSRPGHVLVVGRDRAEAQRSLAQVRERVRIEYEDGAIATPTPLPDAEAQHARS